MKILIVLLVAISFHENEGQKRLSVTTILDTPYTMRSSSEGLEGYCIDLWAKIAAKLNLEYDIHVVNDSYYGVINSQGKWNGMIGEVIRGEADVALASLTITAQREKAISFTQPFMTSGISMITKIPNTDTWIRFCRPFTCWTWISFITAVIVVQILLVADEKINSNSSDLKKKRSISSRILNCFFWIFVFLMGVAYVSHYMSMASNPVSHKINTVQDLLDSDMEYGFKSGGSTFQFFKTSKNSKYNQIYEQMTLNPGALSKSNAEGIDKVRRGNYVHFMESSSTEYVNNQEPCDTMRVGPIFNEVGYGLVLAKNSPLYDQINSAVIELKQSGELKSLQSRWWSGSCRPGDRSKIHVQSLDIGKLFGAFVVLFVGLVAAAVATVLSRRSSKFQALKSPDINNFQ